MNVRYTKLTCWALTAILTLALGFVVWQHLEREKERRAGSQDGGLQVVDREYVRSILDADNEPELDVKMGLDYDSQVRPAFIDMNWTGYRAPPPVVKPTDNTGPAKPKYRPIDEVLRVVLIAVDVTDAGGSRAFVSYLQNAVEDVLRVGDELARPNDYAVVHAIHLESVEFAFKQPGRPNERVAPRMVDDSNLIVQVGEGGLLEPVKRTIPRLVRRTRENPAQTRQVGNNHFQLGQEDMTYFSDNYAEVLTSELQTSTYYDENGRRAGIEIQSVKAGSVAARHGAQAGDVLISINGNPVSSEHEAINFVKNNSDKYTVWEVVVQRLGKQETIVYKNPD